MKKLTCKLHPKYKCKKMPTSTKEGCICREIWFNHVQKQYEIFDKKYNKNKTSETGRCCITGKVINMKKFRKDTRKHFGQLIKFLNAKII